MFESKKRIPPNQRLIVALDVDTPREAMELVEALGESVTFYKMGLQLFMAGGYFELMEELKKAHKEIFVDLKFFDVPQTVGSAVRRLEDKGATFVSVHGNDAILKAAVNAKEDLKILAVTVLTSLDEGDLNDLGFQCNVEQLVLSRAKRALQIGCDGIVSSGLEASAIRNELGEKLLIVTPGIRPVANCRVDDQKRIMTPKDAFKAGADYIVMGRPIRTATDPRAKAEEVQQVIRDVFED